MNCVVLNQFIKSNLKNEKKFYKYFKISLLDIKYLIKINLKLN